MAGPFYVDGAVADDTGNGLSWATAKKYIRSGCNLLNNGETLYVRYGTYDDQTSYIVSSKNNITIQAEFPDDETLLPIIDGTSQPNAFGIYITGGTGQTVKGFYLKNWNKSGYTGLFNEGAANYFDHIWLENCAYAGTTTTAVQHSGVGTANFNRIFIFANTSAIGRGIYVSSGAGANLVTVTNSKIYGEDGKIRNGISCAHAGGMKIDNVDIFGCYYSNIFIFNAASTSAVNNCILSMVNSTTVLGYNVRAEDGATVNVDHTLALNATGNPATYTYSAIGGGAINVTNEHLTTDGRLFSDNYLNQGIVTVSWDFDSYPAGVSRDIADVFAQAGIPATVFVNQAFFDTTDAGRGTATTEDILYIKGKGVDIGSHGWSHSHLTAVDLTPFSITYSGTGTCNLTIAGDSLTTAIVGGSGEEALNINLADYSLKDSHIKTLCDFIHAKTDYNCTWIGGTDGVALQRYAQARVLANQTHALSGVAYSLTVDATRLYQHEIIDNNSWVESITGESCASFAYAANSGNAGTLALLRGLDGSSSGQMITCSTGPSATGTVNSLASYDILNGDRFHPTEMDQKTTLNQIRDWRNLGWLCRIYGRCFHLYFHQDDFDGTAMPTYGENMTAQTKSDLRSGLETLKQTGVTILSMRQLKTYLLANGWVNTADSVYTKALGTPSYVPRLMAGSILANTGANVGLTTDYNNDTVPYLGGYPIGAYRGEPAGGGLSPGLGLSGGNRPPWWNRRRR